jgi:EmrB/QacA subfamily drug resistance transporter
VNSPSRRGLVIAAILLSMFMSAMEATVVATAMPTIVADLHGIELYGWVGSIYMLASTVSIPLWGSLADLRGRKPAMLWGMGFFLLGSVMSGASRTMAMLVLSRAVQGIGAGSLQPVSLTIVGDLYTVEERGRIQGYFGALWGVAGMAGPLLGGLIVRALSWQWVFYINLPFGLLSGAMLVAFFHEAADLARKSRRLDLAGAVTLTVSVLSLLLGVGGSHPSLTLPLAALSFGAFIAVERRAAEPVVPLSLFAHRTIAVASVVGTLMGTVMMSTLMFLPLFMQAARGATPTEAGTTVAPMLLGWPLASTVSGRLLPRVGPRSLVRAGLAFVLVGTLAVWLLVGGRASANALRVAMFAFGTGMGLANTALLIAVQESVGQAQRGIATATSMFSRSIGGAVSVGALGALLAHRLAGVVDEAQLNAMLGPARGRSLDAHAVAVMAGAVERAMLPIFVVIAAVGALAAACGMAFPDVSLSRRAVATPPVGE